MMLYEYRITLGGHATIEFCNIIDLRLLIDHTPLTGPFFYTNVKSNRNRN